MSNIPKNYDPKEFEDRIYKMWEDSGYFKAKIDPSREPYSIVLPPPNITGQLHMGHALDHTLQDILIRWKRMQGYNTLWQPGTDHASIATEVKVVERVKEKEGLTKEELGREEFLKRAWAWKEEFGGRIVEQMKKLGDSCDWERERFTMDEGCNEAVTEFFIKLYEQGHIYRGNRIINWCVDCKTSLSDAEVEHDEVAGNFYHVIYKVKDSDETIEIATTRPETILGDTAVAVNKEDERYKHLIGKILILPILNREIPVIEDDYVDMEFGTGAVKITPAHDPNDFEVGQRHNLPQLIVMNEDGTMNEKAGKYEGMTRFECRKAIVKDLDDMGQLVKVKEHTHNVGHCYRCNNVVEPLVSKQWFVKMKDLAKPAIDALENKDLELVPDRFDKTYMNWLENIRDWCISRQLWWGHRIPAYYCQDCDEIMVSREKPNQCIKCKSFDLRQDEDVLDTWFSSALWPFSTLGWPKMTREINHFYPTSTLVTGYDIIFFWVIRMVFSSLFIMDEVPFKHVFIHGLVRDSEGRKMSKSLGNGIDPLEIIDTYGADALRFTLATGNSPGNDMRFHMEKVESSRNFANKIWNASRFIFMHLENMENKSFVREDVEPYLELSDKWIISRVNTLSNEMTDNMEKFELGIAVGKVYDFAWSEFCDWYIELVKARLFSDDENTKKAAMYTLLYVLKKILKLLHPFMPFITEEIWSYIGEDKAIIVSDWPVYKDEDNFKSEEDDMQIIVNAIRNIRNVRAEMNVPPSKKAKLIVLSEGTSKTALEKGHDYFINLASASSVSYIGDEKEIPEDAMSAVIEGAKLFMPMDELVDFAKELERLEKEKAKLEGEIKRVAGKLSNEGFIKKAPQSLIDEEKGKQSKFEDMYRAVIERLDFVKSKL
ncbi:valyl-tRNA synthetase [Acetoanaerobium pronyense]|uniref:Valine--tRNA ligase n=1 Tax=Acetoanaerobium pronyense TaxID=1482736 RepID=A0ABS4KFI5_9FIRM|nr:valine--tRNA ligase [Acetoanaerobium pronyense]MBP2026538.1 valyl-tRNA synthetase [Acetoanaerobium pronyense]